MANSEILIFLLEQLYTDFTDYVSVNDLVSLLATYKIKTRPIMHKRLVGVIRDRMDNFNAQVDMAGHTSSVKYVSGERRGNRTTERWMFVEPIHSRSLPVDTFTTTLYTPLKRIILNHPLVQSTPALIPPEKLQDKMAELVICRTNVATAWLYYSYDDHETLSNGTYFDFLNRTYDHLLLRGIRIEYDADALNGRIMGVMCGLGPFVTSIVASETKSKILFTGVWAMICSIVYFAGNQIQISPQTAIF
jgi:hypothetical protein